MTTHQEEAILFGPQGKLMGVLSRAADPGEVACLMFNFGVTHRVGPRRIQVKLARRLAQQGVASLRFDLSGLGDSQTSETSQSFEEQALGDLRLACDQIESRLGVRRVIVIGLCSGAAHGLQAALADPRIAGLLNFDGYAFTSRAAQLERRVRRFLRFPAAQTRHWIERLLGTDRAPDGDLLRTGVRAKILTADDFRRDAETLVARGVAVYLVYSGTLQSRDRNKDQLHGLRGCAVLDQVRYEFMPHVDHSFTEIAGQEFFLDAVSHWVAGIQLKHAGLAPATPAAEPARKATKHLAGSSATAC
jgi:pimeloyl-ACP methyl ester carboxylesterase